MWWAGLTGRETQLEISYGGHRLNWWVGAKSDLDVMNDILVHGIFASNGAKSILDLGSHIGVSILAFRVANPEARIVGLEPDPRSFERLRRNVAPLGVEVRQEAVSASEGTISLPTGY